MKKLILLLFIVCTTHACIGDDQPKTLVRFRVYLSPSIPQELYQLIVDYINKTTNLNIVLSFEFVHSGPSRSCSDPFSSCEVDIAHVCAPPFIWLASRDQSPIQLLPIALIFKDERAHCKPVYFSEVIVAANNSITSFDELKGKTWCYNDPESLSGYFCMLQKLAQMKQTTSFFNKIYESGNHIASIQLVARGEIDGSAIDSNVLALQLKEHPELKQKIRVIESWGPFPIQPLIARRDLPDEIKEIFITALLHMAVDEKDALSEYLVDGFGPIFDQDFDGERQLLCDCEYVINDLIKSLSRSPMNRG